MPALVWQSDTLKPFALPATSGNRVVTRLTNPIHLTKYPIPEPLRARARRLVRQDTEAAQDLAAREAAAEEERQRVRARLTRAVRYGTPGASQWRVACGGSFSVTAL